MRVLAFAYTGSGGDFHPVVGICLGLRARGHDVRLFCDPEGARAVASSGLATLVDEVWTEVAEVQRGYARIRDATGSERLRLTVELLSRRTALLAPAFAATVRTWGPDLVLSAKLMGAAAREGAVAAGVPWCVVNSTYDTRRDASDNALLASTAGAMRDAPLVIHATDPLFDDGPPVADEQYVGPVLWEPREAPVPSYLLEPGPAWALVTVSLIPQGDIAIVPVALTALSDLGLRSVATIGARNDPSGAGTPPKGAHVERSISHAAVLERARIMVGHAGYGSVGKAMWYGVPMVLVPWGRDQPGVALRAARLGVARVVESGELTAIPDAIRAVLVDESYSRRAAQHSRRLRSRDPVALACDILDAKFATSVR